MLVFIIWLMLLDVCWEHSSPVGPIRLVGSLMPDSSNSDGRSQCVSSHRLKSGYQPQLVHKSFMSIGFSGSALAFCGYSGSGKTELLLNCLTLLKGRTPVVLKTSSKFTLSLPVKIANASLTKVRHWSTSRILLKSSTSSRYNPSRQPTKLNFVA